MPRPRITAFISATSADLRNYREEAQSQLRIGGIVAHVQEDFEPSTLTLEEYLHRSIAASDVVICLVGSVYGAEPPQSTAPRRSYTQLEFDQARELNKPLFVYLATQDYERSSAGSHDTAEQAELQRRHWETIRNGALPGLPKYTSFTNRSQLATLIAQSVKGIYEQAGWIPIHYSGGTPQPPKVFCGRSQELHDLQQALDSEAPTIVSVVGMGGQGKSTLVYQALRSRQHYWFGAGLWFAAQGRSFEEFLEQAVHRLASSRAAASPLRSWIQESEQAELKRRWKLQLLDALQERPTLIVIDAAEHWFHGLSSSPGGEGRSTLQSRRSIDPMVDDFLRDVGGLHNHSHVVITSRTVPAVLDRADVTTIPLLPRDRIDRSLPGLSIPEAVALLRSNGVQGDDKDLEDVAQRYACHPMALTLVTSMLQTYK